MPSSWKYKTILLTLVTLFSIYLLIPSVLGIKEMAEQHKRSGLTMPWYTKILPQKEVNLGLDLRGGVYMELTIGIDEALTHQINFVVNEIQRGIISDTFKDAKIAQIAGKKLRVELGSNSAGDFKGELVRFFGNGIFDIRTEKPEIFLEVKGDVSEARKQAYLAAQGVPHFKGNVDIIHDNKLLAVSFEDSSLRIDVLKVLKNPAYATFFSEVTDEINDVMYLSLSSTYLDHLKQNIVEQASNSVRNRIDRFGVVEASVSRQSSDRLVVELPGVKDADRVVDIIRRTGKLEFRLVDHTIQQPRVEMLVEEKIAELKLDKALIYEKSNVNQLNEVLKAELPPDTEIAFELRRSAETKKVLKSTPYLLQKKVDVTGDMLENASVQYDNNRPYVSMVFNKAGADAFGELTSKNVGKYLAIVLDGVVSSAPVIKTAIMGGQAQIELGYGSYSNLQREASELVLILKEGALPASLTVATKNVIGPSLGQDSIEAGLKSLLGAALVVVLFMFLYYKVGGLIANFALILNVVYIFAALSLFQASLTLPGIAGIVLTMGMAVDANVIIFERMREEIYLKADPAFVVQSGYSHAITAIIDGNVTTLIAGLVLFQFGTGPIKGFATTLMIGIITTLVTAIIVTRLVYDWLLGVVKIEKVRI